MQKVTEYFTEKVMKKRPYIKAEWVEYVVKNPVLTEIQPENNRIRHWAFIDEIGKYLRVVTLSDGETIHNAFPDRNFKI